MFAKGILDKLFSTEERDNGYTWEAGSHGLDFHAPSSRVNRITQGNAGLWITQQHVAMMMLVEQGKAEVIPNGFIIETNVAVRLDRTTKDFLGLPLDWYGRIEADIQGDTRRSTFAVVLKIQNEGSSLTRSYRVSGPFLQIGTTQQYTLTPAQQHIFGAVETHQSSKKTEYDNLRLLLALQEGQKAGANINLAHFEKKDIKAVQRQLFLRVSDNYNSRINALISR